REAIHVESSLTLKSATPDPLAKPEPQSKSPSTRKQKQTAIMGKVHGSLARAGKVKSQTPK
ncbi:MAG: hypothetical protein L6R42_004205, partial [Xanthoria sp. 1 TBL-2021]